jgi:hypothetical protein
MALLHITDHQVRALARLISKYREATNVRGVVSESTAETQAIEDELWEMFIETIDSAENAQLDVFGRIVNQPREGRDDPTYRLWIKTRVLMNRSSGTGSQLLAIFTALVSGTTFIHLEEQFPAALALKMGSTPSLLPIEANRILQRCKAAGVRALLELQNYPDGETFTLDIGPGLDVGHLADDVTESWAPLPAPPPPGGMWTEYALPILAMCAASNGSRTVAAGEGIAYSDDGGQTWTEVTSPPAGTWYAALWDGTNFVLVGVSGACATSPTGGIGAWTPRTLPELSDCYDLASNGTTIIAVNATGLALLSTDHGESWTAHDIVPDETGPWLTIAHDGTNWIATVNSYSYPSFKVLSAISATGETWTLGEIPVVSELGFNMSTAISIGSAIIALEWSEPDLEDLVTGSVKSVDHGGTWGTVHSMPAMEIYGKVWTGAELFVVGSTDYRLGSPVGLCSSSPDGETWTAEDGFSTPMYALVKVGDTLVAVGDHVAAVATLPS